MTREQYQTIRIFDLRELAKGRGIKRTSTMKKGDLIEAMLALDAEEERAAGAAAKAQRAAGQKAEDADKEVKELEKELVKAPEKEQETEPEKEPAAEAAPAVKRRGRPRKAAADVSAETRDGSVRGRGMRKTGRNMPSRVRAEDNEADSHAGNETGVAARDQRTGEAARDQQAQDRRAGEPSQDQRAESAEDHRAGDGAQHTHVGEGAQHHHDPKVSENAPQVRGILEVMQDGFGFLRSDNFLPGEDDVYVSPSQIRRFNLKTGDMITGNKRERAQGEKYGALLYVSKVNDHPADEARRRPHFESMTPIFPDERIRLERPDGSRATRIVDLISPIGKGQRGMIVSPPKAGKTTLLKDIARSILTADPDQYLIILLIDERPEEVTDMKESVFGKNVEIIYSTFDELPDHHKRVSEMVIERAKRLVEHHEDVIILLDSITRLTRAYNVLVPQSGRTLSGGLDPTALYMPKRFFGAARNIREGGSLTILATALVDTGSKMDDVVYEEFKGTGNMELILDRKLQERRIFPAIDIIKSGTRREDLLLTEREHRAADIMRRRMNGAKSEESVEAILQAFAHYPTNEQVVSAILSKWGQ